MRSKETRNRIVQIIRAIFSNTPFAVVLLLPFNVYDMAILFIPTLIVMAVIQQLIVSFTLALHDLLARFL